MITDFKNNKQTEQSNKSGLCSFKFCPVSFVDQMPLASDGAYIDPITFHSGKNWLNGYATYDTLLWDEDPQGGGLFAPSLKGFCPTDEPDNVALFTAMRAERFLILAKDRHGREVLSGNIQHGLIFNFKRTKGNRANNAQGQMFEFGGIVLPWPSYYYSE